MELFSNIFSSVGILFLVLFIFQRGHVFGIGDMMMNAWDFSTRIVVLGHAAAFSAAAYYIGQASSKDAHLFLAPTQIVAAFLWIWFLYLEGQSVKWETYLRATLAVVTWHKGYANLTPADAEKVMEFLMSNEDMLAKIVECVDERHKRRIVNAQIDLKKGGTI